jgi:hypothetical protein
VRQYLKEHPEITNALNTQIRAKKLPQLAGADAGATA